MKILERLIKKIWKSLLIKTLDEWIYKYIEDLEYAYDIIKKLKETNQYVDELIVEKLVKLLYGSFTMFI